MEVGELAQHGGGVGRVPLSQGSRIPAPNPAPPPPAQMLLHQLQSEAVP